MLRIALASMLVFALADAIPGCFQRPRDPRPLPPWECPPQTNTTDQGCEVRPCNDDRDCPRRNCRETALCIGGDPTQIVVCGSGGLCEDPRARCEVAMRCLDPLP